MALEEAAMTVNAFLWMMAVITFLSIFALVVGYLIGRSQP
jgi:ABC-type transport system involved in multi-copper enzyme maturation permease subunit